MFAAFLLTAALSASAVFVFADSETAAYVTPTGDVTELYVSIDGDDSAAGTKEAPFRTLERARDEVRRLNGDMKGDIVVNVGEGVYTLDSTFELTSEDSGDGEYRVIYKGAGKEKTVISGGVTLDGWTLYDAENNIYSADVPDGADFRQLYVNGEKMTRARSGNTGEYKTRINGAERIRDGEVLPELMSVDNADSRAQADDGAIYL